MKEQHMQERHYLVPHHASGAETDIVYKLNTDFVEDAEDLFVDAKDRLLGVTDWAKYAGIETVHFGLADGGGQAVRRHVRRGDHILINADLASGSEHIDNFDWFTIDALEYDDYPDTNIETFAIRMHPSKQEPGADGTMEDTATIVIERNGKALSAKYHGRNNTTGASDVWHGLDETQWAALMEGLLEYFD